MKTGILLVALLFTILANASQPRKVLLIGIDGTRSDAFQKANTPNIDAILPTSFFTYESWHRGITISGPSWSSILCGVEYKKHGVRDNTYENNHFDVYPYFTTRAKTCLPDLFCVQIVQWAAMSDYVYNDGWNKKIKVEDGQGTQSVSEAQKELMNENLDVLFVYFDEVDIAGHTSGFNPHNPEYIRAIEKVDSHVGNILTALHNRPNYTNEEWIVLIVTDHGGIYTGHGGDTPWERQIWWIGAGNRNAPGQLTHVKDPGSIHIGIYDPVIGAQSPAQCDIATTAIDHLFRHSECKINADWNLDGKSWLDSIYTDPVTALQNHVQANLDFNFYPNPCNGLLTLWFDNPNAEKINYEIKDINGRIIEQKAGIIGNSAHKLNIDFYDKPKGIYFITLFTGKNKRTKRIVIE